VIPPQEVERTARCTNRRKQHRGLPNAGTHGPRGMAWSPGDGASSARSSVCLIVGLGFQDYYNCCSELGKRDIVLKMRARAWLRRRKLTFCRGERIVPLRRLCILREKLAESGGG